MEEIFLYTYLISAFVASFNIKKMLAKSEKRVVEMRKAQGQVIAATRVAAVAMISTTIMILLPLINTALMFVTVLDWFVVDTKEKK